MFDVGGIWILITAISAAVACALVGNFLVLRKMSMVGDSISHSVLPGIVIAYLLFEDRASFPLLIGAALFGFLAVILTELLIKKALIQKDASLGIVFTFLFSIGIILLAYFTGGNIDIDQECVLYGDLVQINLNKVIIDGNLYIGPQVFWNILPIIVLEVIFVTVGFKALLATSFNQDYAHVKGLRVKFWHYSLMLLVSFVSVVTFEAVGAILVIGLMIIPPSTGKLLSNTVRGMLWVSLLIGTLSSFIGFYLAHQWNISISGSIVSVAGAFFLVAFVLHPQSKVIRRKKILNEPSK